MKHAVDSNDFVEPESETLLRAYKLLRSDPQAALHELHDLAARGSRTSMLYIGDSFAKGRSVAKDLTEAEEWFRKVANAGCLLGYYMLGHLYYKRGEFGPASVEFERAVQMRYVPAMHLLSRMYFSGKGVPKNEVMGEQLLQRATDAGSILAKAALGQYLRRTGTGPRSKLRGVWYWIAARIEFLVVVATEGQTSDRLR